MSESTTNEKECYAEGYTFRFVSGRTIRVYSRADGLVEVGDCVVMRKKRPLALFNTEAAAEIFCKDFKGKGWRVSSRAHDVLGGVCPMCHSSGMAAVIDESKELQAGVRICRDCGYHTKEGEAHGS
jgi:Zn ribbon nucleic-acid-binding protein